MFDLDLDGVFDELLEQLQPTPKPAPETQIDSGTSYDDMDMAYRQTHNK
jgi:hypothetical protein